MPEDAPLAEVVRDGVVESVHRGHVAIADDAGRLLAGLGRPDDWYYPRSALKPLQAAATLEALEGEGCDLDVEGLAIVSASHAASNTQQVEAARVLALAGVDETALRCPKARPVDDAALDEDPSPTRLAHNCSGKHAGFLFAHTAAGGKPEEYLRPSTPLQCGIRDLIVHLTGAEPRGPGVDGCGAPAWLLPLSSIAVAFARLAAARTGTLAAVRDAMRRFPELVGGTGAADTGLMQSQPGLIAKRGAEGVLVAGWVGPAGPRGVAVKIADGGGRAAGPVMAAVLAGMGARVPGTVRFGPVFGGGERRGHVAAVDGLVSLTGQGFAM